MRAVRIGIPELQRGVPAELVIEAHAGVANLHVEVGEVRLRLRVAGVDSERRSGPELNVGAADDAVPEAVVRDDRVVDVGLRPRVGHERGLRALPAGRQRARQELEGIAGGVVPARAGVKRHPPSHRRRQPQAEAVVGARQVAEGRIEAERAVEPSPEIPLPVRPIEQQARPGVVERSPHAGGEPGGGAREPRLTRRRTARLLREHVVVIAAEELHQQIEASAAFGEATGVSGPEDRRALRRGRFGLGRETARLRRGRLRRLSVGPGSADADADADDEGCNGRSAHGAC